MKRFFTALVILSFTMPVSAQFHNKNGVVRKSGTTISRSGSKIEVNDKAVEFNRCSSADTEIVFLTHARRDVVEAIRENATEKTQIIAPEASREFLENAEQHWQEWWEKQFNYYGQQVTKWPVRNFPATRYVKEGDKIEWNGFTFTVIETPGYTRDAVSYLVEGRPFPIPYLGDLKVETSFDSWIVTGDSFLSGGKVPDLYSFQDAIPEAKIGAYHGYGAHFATWISSIEKLKRKDYDDFPLQIYSAANSEPLADGDPAKTIDEAIARLRKIYRNYWESNALHWYFGEERMGAAATRTLGENHGATPLMTPFAEHVDLPEWCVHIGTTKLLVSKSGHGFALDVGGQKQFDEIQKALDSGLIQKLEGIWVTHTHNDHTKLIPEAALQFDCPVYAVKEVANVMLNPGAWFLPGVIPEPVDPERMKIVADGETWKWRNFTFTSHFYPGQMYNHGALLVEKADHKSVFFIGDSFSPSGLDDYCMMNRNLMRDDTGYALCFQKIGELPEGSWLVNQHIPHLFRFSDAQLGKLENAYAERKKLIGEMVAWDDPNYAIDEQWAWFFPYGQKAKRGSEVKVSLGIWNHSPVDRVFNVKLHGNGSGFDFENGVASKLIPAGERKEVEFLVKVSPEAEKRVHVVTADISSLGEPVISLKHWCEALILVE